MTVEFSRPRLRRLSLGGIVLLSLTLSALFAVPSGVHTSSPRSGVGTSRQSSSVQQEMMTAAAASLESGHGPLGLSPMNCLATGFASTLCGARQNTFVASGSSPEWSEISSSPPPPQFSPTMAYDLADGYVVLFGGIQAGNNIVGHTWTFVGGSWTNTSAIGPSPRLGASMAYDSADGYLVFFGGIDSSPANNFLKDTWKFLNGVWTNITLTTGPSPRALTTLTYDVSDGYLVLFGGGSGIFNVFPTNALHDTWRFLAASWTNITASGGPSPRFGASMAYDSADTDVILFGGLSAGAGTFFGDTWKFLAGSWANITAIGGPSSRFAASMAYDPADSYTVLFGGLLGTRGTGSIGWGRDTWRFLAAVWTNIPASRSPSSRELASMAYDGANSYVVLFGGANNSNIFADTWKFLGGGWTNLTFTPGPSVRIGAAMAYDAADGYAVLFGGFGAAGSVSDTWKFAGGSWSNITVGSAPSPRISASMSYDAADGYIVLFGGARSNNFASAPPFSDTWKFRGGVWTNITTTPGPSPRVASAFAYDIADGYAVLVGGLGSKGPLSDTWKFSANVWTNITQTTGPSPRIGAGIAYDPPDGYVVLFGGGSTGDTWKFLGGSWTNITSSTHPPPRVFSGMAYDAADRYIVLNGGGVFGGAFYCDTWQFLSGSWTNITASSGASPCLRFGPGAMTYDAGDGYVILFDDVSTWKYSPVVASPLHDVAVTAVSVSPTQVTGGGTVTIV